MTNGNGNGMNYTTQECRIGDAHELLQAIPDESVDTVVTSPPYWGLRNYNVDSQIGLEETLEEYHNRLLEVTAELYRVLKTTGVIFWNHGDSYYAGGGKAVEQSYKRQAEIDTGSYPDYSPSAKLRGTMGKCLTMQNERLIMRMIDEQGWILRNRIIWNKPNGMPSSVTDRFSNKYEPVYMLVKSKKYWFDLDAVRVPHKENSLKRWKPGSERTETTADVKNAVVKKVNPTYITAKSGDLLNPFGKNPGDVWSTPPERKQFDSSMGGGGAGFKGHSGYYSADGTLLAHPLGKNPGDVRIIIESPEDDWKQLLETASEIVGIEAAIAIFESYMQTKEYPADIWTIPTQPYPGSHFATFPVALVEMAIKAGCPPEICPICGHIRERIVDREFVPQQDVSEEKGVRGAQEQKPMDDSNKWQGVPRGTTTHHTTGWTSCGCNAGWIAGTTLDPFAGSGTVLKVCRLLNRNAIGLELNPEYERLIKERSMNHTPPLGAYV